MYTIWTDYGLEGWKPEDFDDMKSFKDAILNNDRYGMGLRYTKTLLIEVKIDE